MARQDLEPDERDKRLQTARYVELDAGYWYNPDHVIRLWPGPRESTFIELTDRRTLNLPIPFDQAKRLLGGASPPHG